MAEEEKILVIPLASLTKDVPRTQKSKRAIREIRTYVANHIKIAGEASEEGEEKNTIWIDPLVNDLVWSRGGKRIPRRIKVRAIKFEGGLIEVSPLEAEKEAPKEKKKDSEKPRAETGEEPELLSVEDEEKKAEEMAEPKADKAEKEDAKPEKKQQSRAPKKKKQNEPDGKKETL